MTFLAPEWLFLMFIVPLLAWWSLRADRSSTSLAYSSLGIFRAAGPTWRVRFRHAPLIVRTIALMLAVLALARPVQRDVTVEQTVEGIDIILALDISTSMRAPDFYPNRMEAARSVAIEFVQARTTDRIGLVIFAGQAFTQVPLTTDYRYVTRMLEDVRMGIVEDGTAIGSAIAVSTNRLRASDADSRVLILLTDGQNNRGEIDPFTAAEVAAAMGVRIHAIGIGMTASMLAEEQSVGRAGGPIEVDEDGLLALTASTGGRYYHARDRDALRNVYAEIDQLERTTIETATEHREYDRFAWFLIPALGLLFLEVLGSSTIFRIWP